LLLDQSLDCFRDEARRIAPTLPACHPYAVSVHRASEPAQFRSTVARLLPNLIPKKLLMAIRVPVGLYLPAGLSIKVDDGNAQSIPLQTCDLQGCYAETEIGPAMATALKTGKHSINCQDPSKKQIVLPLTLDGFATAFEKIQ
jgi:invasion protein IalB